jgi:hypothetical protein
MCDSSSDPTTYDTPRKRPACQRRIWVRGVDRPCGIEFGVTTWTDEHGVVHTACRHHKAEVLYRHPEAMPA